MKKILFLLCLFSISAFSQKIINKGNSFYLSNTLIIKYKNSYAVNDNKIQSVIRKELKGEITKKEPIFPEIGNKLFKGAEVLSNIYQVEYNSSEDPQIAAIKISKQPLIEYAEPRYIQRIVDSPNDSLYSYQSNLTQISASKAWDITKGSSKVIIGIVDTGVDCAHPDLAAHIVKGIDLGGLAGVPDDDPSEDVTPSQYERKAYHGTHVAGIASAVSGNKTGIASIGYNCSLMPIKVTRNDVRDENGNPLIYYGYEGIKYAADHGAKIINCSWGGYSYSRFEQDIIDYATAKGALIVAAQGNENKIIPFYPANYKNVLSVGWCDGDDKKNENANYGKDVDVMAPGSFILSTWPKIANNNPNDYNQFMSGSSMASPLVAGLAGLVADKFPNYSPQQIAEQIRVTSDDIYFTNSSDMQNLLGKGRINAYRAVSETNAVSVRIINAAYSNGTNGIYKTGDEVTVKTTLENFLSPVNGLKIDVKCFDAFIQITKIVGSNISMAEKDTSSNKFSFTFKINEGAPFDCDVSFLVTFNAISYSDFQWLTIRINPTYINHNSNKITMSITSKGTLGFTDFPANLYGHGFRFNGGDNLLFEGAFMYGNSSSTVMNAARETTEQSHDFLMVSPISISTDQSGKQISKTVFNDLGATTPLGIETTQTNYSFVNSPDDKYVIIVNELKNTTDKNITNLYAGYYLDWDLPADKPEIDSVSYDQKNNFAYAFCTDKTKLNTVVGAALISSSNFGYYPIDNNASTGEVVFNNGFTTDEKWISLSSGISKANVGKTDISFVISCGPFNIPAKGSLKVAFAVAAAESLSDLSVAINQSRNKYKSEIATSVTKENLSHEFYLFQNYPNPFNPETTISYQLQHACRVTLKVYNILGKEVATLVDEQKEAGIYNAQLSALNYGLSSGVYFYQLRAGSYYQTKKMILIK